MGEAIEAGGDVTLLRRGRSRTGCSGIGSGRLRRYLYLPIRSALRSRVYAAYGGVFIVLSLLWGRLFDGFEPDRWDLMGAGICLIGVLIMYFGPRVR